MKFKEFVKRFEVVKIIVVVIYALVFLWLGKYLATALRKAYPDNPMLASFLVNFIIYIFMFIFTVVLLHKDIKKDYLALNKQNAIKCLILVTIGFAISIMFNVIFNLISEIAKLPSDSINEEGLDLVLRSAYGVPYFFIIAFVGPVVEELVFRRALTDVLRSFKIPRLVVVFIVALVFGFLHVYSGKDYIMVFPYIVMGLVLGFLEYATDSIYIPFILHYINNALSALATLAFGALLLL